MENTLTSTTWQEITSEYRAHNVRPYQEKGPLRYDSAVWNRRGQWNTNRDTGHRLPHTVLLWSAMCVSLLLFLWARLQWAGGRAVGLKDKGDTNLAMENCLIAAAIYTLVGIIATILLTRHSPPSSSVKTTRTEN